MTSQRDIEFRRVRRLTALDCYRYWVSRELKIRRRVMMLYVLPPQAAAGPPSPWSTILCDDGQPPSVHGRGGQQEPATVNGGRLTYKRNASNNRRVKAWLNAVQKNNRPPPPRKPRVDIAVVAGPEV